MGSVVVGVSTVELLITSSVIDPGETGKRGRGGVPNVVTPPSSTQGAFVECLVNGVSRQALIDTGAQVTVISDELFNCLAINSDSHSPVLGANNLPLDIVGKPWWS